MESATMAPGSNPLCRAPTPARAPAKCCWSKISASRPSRDAARDRMNRSARRHIPSYSLYGETPGVIRDTDALHIEDIQSRSRKYLWKIGSHRHTLLSQCVLVTAGPVSVTLDDTRAALSGPAVMIIPAGTVHSFRFRADTL